MIIERSPGRFMRSASDVDRIAEAKARLAGPVRGSATPT